MLRFAIVLPGLQLAAAQMAAVGGVAVPAATLLATFLFTTWMGRLLGVERGLAQLIAAGTSICGASAVIAANTVTGASDEDVAYVDDPFTAEPIRADEMVLVVAPGHEWARQFFTPAHRQRYTTRAAAEFARLLAG